MKRVVIYIAIMLGSFFICNAQKIEQRTMCGTFYKLVQLKDFNTSYTLELNTDSTFKLYINLFEGSSQCIGKWKILDSIFIMLKCNEDTNPYEMLSSGYMSQKEYKLQIISKNRIRYKDVVLKRKK